MMSKILDYPSVDKKAFVLVDQGEIESLLSRDKIRDSDLMGLHIRLDGMYQKLISGWYEGMCCTGEKGFNYQSLDRRSLISNLFLMKAKLEGYLRGFNDAKTDISSASQDVNVTVNNAVNITISFEEAKRKIEEIPGLTDSETEEIKSTIDELEQISKEDVPKKKKWEKIKPILAFALDKGADVAVAIMGLFLQMKLGV